MRRRAAFTMVELVAVLAISMLLVVALGGVVSVALRSDAESRDRRERTREARFAMERITRAVGEASLLLVPRDDDPGTAWDESRRDVLAVDLDPTRDLDADGIGDADNDGDGSIDEDPGADRNGDGAPGILGIDDDGDGLVDESSSIDDDDEDEDLRGTKDEDWVDGTDKDGDGSADEDPGADRNGDGAAGMLGIDDDGDGQVDESSVDDDDEDEDDRGTKDEDWIDTVVFFLQGATLIERTPVPWDANASGSVTGADFVESPLAEGVSLFQVERVPPASGGDQLVGVTLELTGAEGAVTRLETRVRLGGRR